MPFLIDFRVRRVLKVYQLAVGKYVSFYFTLCSCWPSCTVRLDLHFIILSDRIYLFRLMDQMEYSILISVVTSFMGNNFQWFLSVLLLNYLNIASLNCFLLYFLWPGDNTYSLPHIFLWMRFDLEFNLKLCNCFDAFHCGMLQNIHHRLCQRTLLQRSHTCSQRKQLVTFYVSRHRILI